MLPKMIKNYFLYFVFSLVSAELIAEEYNINFVPSSTNPLQQGFLRFTNPNLDSVSVSIVGVDDSGSVGQTSLSFTLDSLASKQLNSDDIEFGNASKGLLGFLGVGSENWRLKVTTTGELGVSSYLRTTEGFMTKIGDLVANTNQTSHIVPIFNPASNVNQVSILRVTNLSNSLNDVSIIGIDDNGDISSTASITLAANKSIMLTAQDIENGTQGLSNGIGNGAGKWQLFVTTSEVAAIMSLLQAPGGYISNLSRPGS